MSRTIAQFLFLVSIPVVASAQSEEPRLSGRLFADLSYTASERTIPQGFRLGQLVAHGSATLTDRLAFFGEATATAGATGYSVEVERSILRYDFSDALRVGAGRFHTPLGHWNTAYHHGVWLQATTGRPEMLRGDRPLFPIHFVGLVVDGQLASRILGLSYAAGLGNGRAASVTRAGDAGDVNANRARLASLAISPPKLAGARVGASVYEDVVSTAAGATVSERLLVTFLTFDRGPLEFVTEGLLLRHQDRAPGSAATENHAGYALLAYRLPGRAASLKPYARYDRVAPSATDVILRTTPMDMSGWAAGLRYDFASLAAMKTEFRRERAQSPRWRNTAVFQLSITFPGLRNTDVHVAGEEHNPVPPPLEGR